MNPIPMVLYGDTVKLAASEALERIGAVKEGVFRERLTATLSR